MPTEHWYALVFNQDREIGQPPDPKQHWFKGDCYSSGSDTARTPEEYREKNKTPEYFDIVPLEREPIHAWERWHPAKKAFVDVRRIPDR